MKSVTLREAKAHLNQLVEAARRGEQVVLMRGSKHVAALVPISDEELELAPRLTDEQAGRLWQQLKQRHLSGKTAVFASVERAVAHLGKDRRRGPARTKR